jgi:hypoxanthine phosphoribosyltransferase
MLGIWKYDSPRRASSALPPSQRPAFRELFSEERIQTRLKSLSDEIAQVMPPEFLAVAILKGSFVFAADLIRAFHRRGIRPEVDFMTISSYGLGAKSTGSVKLLRDVEVALDGRSVLLIDDILDSGGTLAFAASHLRERGVDQIAACVLLDKGRLERIPVVERAFAGFACPDGFVVGYGMDYAHRYRELPFIAMLDRLDGGA